MVMSQNTDPQPDTWHAPWATPAQDRPVSGAPSTTVDPAAPGDRPGQSDPSAVRPTQLLTPMSGFGPPPQPLAPGRDQRRPGWGGVLTVGVGAAVLSSLLTAGLFTLNTADSGQPSTGSSTAASQTRPAAPLVTGAGDMPDWGGVADAVEPSVVSVQVATARGGGEGSGIILDTSGRILTNNHVVAEAANGGEVSVILSDKRIYSAELVGADAETDLAVIKIGKPPSGLKPAVLGDSSSIRVGDPVMAVGNPLGLSETATTGIVSALNRPVSASSGQGAGSGEQVITNAIQTDAAINPGNSGGALVDSGGRIIGITSSIASLNSPFGGQSGNIGLGFAIPINDAKQISEELIRTGKVQHSYLGVKLKDNSITIDGAQREAAVILSVDSGTPAANAGIKQGDAIIAFDGRAVDSSDSLVGTIRAIKPETQVTLTIVRNGTKQDIKVTLAQRPSGR
jgi:putative serine protease PepD